jgi:hypothetical protein
MFIRKLYTVLITRRHTSEEINFLSFLSTCVLTILFLPYLTIMTHKLTPLDLAVTQNFSYEADGRSDSEDKCGI